MSMQPLSTPRRPSRTRAGVALLLLAFLPAAIKALAPALWAGLPDVAQWVMFGVSGLCTLGIVALVFTADYGDVGAPGEGTRDASNANR